MAKKDADTSNTLMREKRWGPFSPLTRRILAVNVIALGILGGGILYLDQFRDNLLQRHVSDLEAQAEIIAGAIGESASGGPETRSIEIEPARQIIARLLGPTSSRARLFSIEGQLLADSRFLGLGRTVYVIPLPPPGTKPDWRKRLADWFDTTLDELTSDPEIPRYEEHVGQTAFDYEEALAALAGEKLTVIRSNGDGTRVVSVAVPVQRFRRVLGVLLMTRDTDDIQQIIREERLTILKVFAVSVAVTLLLSVFLASTIARPIRHLARAADEVRHGIGRPKALHKYSNRRDEVGTLSRSLTAMTRALYKQLDAVESFAADVAHELKNPLSSMRSAVETIQRTDDEAIKIKLLAIIEDDVSRLDRLISDISDASRLDAELSRGNMVEVDLGAMVATLVEAYHATAHSDGTVIAFNPPEGSSFLVQGIEARLGQVMRNLLDNAISFSPTGGTVSISLVKGSKSIDFVIEDEGPGLPEEAKEKIFERFYSERPAGEAFGRHSGLGLSISKQIVEAHGGTISAANKQDGTISAANKPAGAGEGPGDSGDTAPGGEPGSNDRSSGARFVVCLPC